MRNFINLSRRQMIISVVAALFVTIAAGYLVGTELIFKHSDDPDTHLLESYTPPPKIERKAGRAEYFHRMLKDPETDRIPADVRSRELDFARKLPRRTMHKMKGKRNGINWQSIGPNNVGGRTRALGIDVSNSDVILAGGVSGGLWKSTDRGESWQLMTEPKQHQSVTSLAQDTRQGHRDTWYFATGELFSGSSSDRGIRARYYGDGVYKSTDNGESWQQMGSTSDEDKTYNSQFDFISRIRVNPTTGSVFIASNGFGIFRSTDGQNFGSQTILGGPGHHLFADIDIAHDGTIAAVLSGRDAGEPSNNPGVFVSTNDGDNWTEVTPSGWPSDSENSYERSVIEIAPSNTDLAYVFTYTGFGEGESEDVLLYRINLKTGESTDLSANLPDYGGSTGFVVTQFNYNMELAVHPNNADFVLLGGRNLYRSRDGFTSNISDPSTKDEHWIGGYSNNNNGFSSYAGHHPDQHIVVFDPNNPSVVWSGHDGGVSKTTDIKREPVSWTDMNNGYNVTQFYTVALPEKKGDNRVMGGTQDNGNPFFRYGTATGSTKSTDIAGGDGGYDYFTDSYVFQSLQNGLVLRFDIWPDGGGIRPREFAWVQPNGADNQLFIHPYVVDPNDQTVMYYPSSDNIWRNKKIDEISYYNDQNSSKTGWQQPLAWQNIAPHNGFNITAITASDTLPKHRLYIGASASEDSDILTDEHPRIYRIDNAKSATNSPQDITIDTSLTEPGAYVHDIAVNPSNADELIAVVSNYNVKSAFYSDDGGQTWSPIEGNLADEQDVMGPSVRSASILPTDDATIYSLGTSAGLYTTTSLSGSSTQWVLEAPNKIGYSITEALDQRTSDDLIAAGTHGRGIFVGSAQGTLQIGPPPSAIPEKFRLKNNYPNPFNPSTTIEYSIPKRSMVNLTIYDLQGRRVREIIHRQIKDIGKYQETFDGHGLASGIYFYRLKAVPMEAGNKPFTETRKMILLK